MAIVELNSVVKEYYLGKVVVPALRDVSVSIERGEFVSIAGPSGSGKTTLLNLVGCVDVATSGTVSVDGQDTAKLTERQLTRLRLDKLGFIFQTFNLVNVLNVFQNVEFPLLLQGRTTAAQRRDRVRYFLEKVGLLTYEKHRPNELSGGQRQRVAIARALVTNPAIILADEPTANLDSGTGNAIIDLMRDINVTEKTTFIFSTHDPKVWSHANRIILLADGNVVDANASHDAMPAYVGVAR